MKLSKRFISTILCITLLVSTLGLTVSAQDQLLKAVDEELSELGNVTIIDTIPIEQIADCEIEFNENVDINVFTTVPEGDGKFAFKQLDDFEVTENVYTFEDESDEYLDSAEVLAALPDLYIDSNSITVNGTQPLEPGRKYIFSYVIENKGTAPAYSIEIDVHVDDGYAGRLNIGTLPAGAVGRGSFELAAWVYDGNYVQITCDPANKIAESNEGNNVALKWFQWMAKNKSIDLVAGLVLPEGDAFIGDVGVPVTIEFAVANFSEIDVPNVEIGILVNGAVTQIFKIDKAPAQKKVLGKYDFTKYVAGTYTTGIDIDPNKKIDDRDRSNNRMETKVIFRQGSPKTYADLRFEWPLDNDYNGKCNYPGHEGLDISARRDSVIWSVDNGTVVFAGFAEDTGYYISVKNDSLDPVKNNGNNIITRYLHINRRSNVYVSATQGKNRVQKGEGIGLVGSRGFTYDEDRRLNHLHIDANSSNIESGSPKGKTIDPEEFWPGMAQTRDVPEYPGDPSDWAGDPGWIPIDSILSECDAIRTNEELLASGAYFDLSLIDLIGEDEFETWISNNPGATVYKLIEDYKLSNVQLESELADHIFDSYAESSPATYKAYFSAN